jgi:hypothetical protein
MNFQKGVLYFSIKKLGKWLYTRAAEADKCNSYAVWTYLCARAIFIHLQHEIHFGKTGANEIAATRRRGIRVKFCSLFTSLSSTEATIRFDGDAFYKPVLQWA